MFVFQTKSGFRKRVALRLVFESWVGEIDWPQLSSATEIFISGSYYDIGLLINWEPRSDVDVGQKCAEACLA